MPVHAWHAGAVAFRGMRRVLVLPVAGERIDEGLRADMTRALLAELGALGRFRAIGLPPGAQDWKALYPTERRGRLDTKVVVELGRRYGADGILLVRVTSFRPYKPPVLGLAAALVSVHTGAILWSAETVHDASLREVELDLRDYYGRVLAPAGDLHGFEFVELSPRAYARYVLHRLVSSLRV